MSHVCYLGKMAVFIFIYFMFSYLLCLVFIVLHLLLAYKYRMDENFCINIWNAK